MIGRIVRKGERVQVAVVGGVVRRPVEEDGVLFDVDPPMFVPASEVFEHARGLQEARENDRLSEPLSLAVRPAKKRKGRRR